MRARHLIVTLVLTLACACGSGPNPSGTTTTTITNTTTTTTSTGGVGGGGDAACPAGYPLSDIHGKPVIDVLIDREGPYSFVYDTGAPTSALDTSLHDELGAGPHVLTIAGKEIHVGGISSYPVQQYLGSTDVHGFVGTDVMEHFVVTLDASRARFWLDDARDETTLLACSHVAQQPVETAWVEAGYLFVPGDMEGRSGWMLVDTGASLGGTTKTTFDLLQSAHPRPALGGFYTAAAVGTFWSQLAGVGYLEVAGRRIEHIITRTMDDNVVPTPSTLDGPLLGLLPTGYLRHFLVTLDYPAGKLRLDGYRDLDPREPSGYFTVGIGLEDNATPPIHVATVLAGSSAEEQGVQVGDVVAKAAGLSFASMPPAQRAWALMAPSAGSVIAVEIEHEGVASTVSLETRDLLTDPTLP